MGKSISKFNHVTSDHDYEKTCQNVSKCLKSDCDQIIEKKLKNEMIDGKNYEIVSRNGEEQFRCRLCPFPFLFGQISDLSRHIEIFHEGKKSHMKQLEQESSEKIETECLDVQQAQEFEKALMHDFIVSNNTEIQKSVPIYVLPHTPHCARSSSALLKRNLEKNGEIVNSAHQRKMLVQCSLCQIVFSELFYLRLHFVNVHQGKEYNSPKLPKEKRSIELVHDGKKKVQCLYCRRIIGQKRNLKRHISTVHERKKLFQCNICLSKFGSKQERKRHIQVIHDES